jgi:hypothetical protein
MNTDVAIQILELVLSLFKSNEQVAVAGILVQIVGKAVQAYQNQTGKAMDPSLIKAEEAI